MGTFIFIVIIYLALGSLYVTSILGSHAPYYVNSKFSFKTLLKYLGTLLALVLLWPLLCILYTWFCFTED